MKFRFILAAVAAASALLFVSCKQDDPSEDDEDPNEEQQIEDKSKIKIDGDFADWAALQNVATAVLPETDAAFEALKVFKAYADASYIFLYFEIDRTDLQTMDLIIDLDNSNATGQTANWTAMGAEVLLQSSFYPDQKGAAVYNPIVRVYGGEEGGTDWAWVDEAGMNFTDSAVSAKTDSIIAVEMRLIREMMVLPNLGDSFTIGAIVENAGWSIIGKLPAEDNGLIVTSEK